MLWPAGRWSNAFHVIMIVTMVTNATPMTNCSRLALMTAWKPPNAMYTATGTAKTMYNTQGCTPNSGARYDDTVQISAADQMTKAMMLNGLTSTRRPNPKRCCSICGCEMALKRRTLGTRMTMVNSSTVHGATIAQMPPMPYM